MLKPDLSMAQHKIKPLVVLSIAGYDPSSGAGVTADVKTIAAHGCYGVTCITALTVQSTRGVTRVEPVDAALISETLEGLGDDLEIAAVKIGMLGAADTATTVAAFLERQRIRHVVLDPVIKSSSGAELITGDGLEILRERLLALASVITPNVDEAAAITCLPVRNALQMEAAAVRLQQLGARNVIITGGHLNPPADLVCGEGKRPMFLKGKKIRSRSTHGTGCAFSSALACELARGKNLLAAARAAKHYVESALRRAPAVGKGIGPIV
jgi:hydroxymethylpyrimidine/phosphomethylpyrimidine kinase